MDYYLKSYRPKRRQRLIKRSRTIPVPGEPVEEYQYRQLLRCWWCGDINTTGREDEDSGKSTMSSHYSMPKIRSLGSRGKTKESILSINSSIFTLKTAPRLGQDGNTKSVKNVWTEISHRGCPSCGTINWSGRY